MKNDKREILIPILAITILIITSIGLSLSFYSYSSNKKDNVIDGSLNMALYSNISLDIEDNVIELNTNKIKEQSLILNIKGTSLDNEKLNYSLLFDIITINNLDSNDIMFSLIEDPSLNMSFEENKKDGKMMSDYLDNPFYKASFTKNGPINDVHSYKLNVWISDEREKYNNYGEISFKIKLSA